VVICATSDQPSLVRLKGRLCRNRHRRIFPRLRQARHAHDGFGHALRPRPAPKWASPAVSLPREPDTRRRCSPNCRSCWSVPEIPKRARSPRSTRCWWPRDDMNEPVADEVGRSSMATFILRANSRAATSIRRFGAGQRQPRNERGDHQGASTERNAHARSPRHLPEEPDLILIGAYQKGSDFRVDDAIERYDGIIEFLKQDVKRQSAVRRNQSPACRNWWEAE